jgi:hypothetical protein
MCCLLSGKSMIPTNCSIHILRLGINFGVRHSAHRSSFLNILEFISRQPR